MKSYSRNGTQGTPAPKNLRCAIYTRKSTEEGLEKEFNTLDAQRESGEAYIRSQQHEGWLCLPNRYDDGGYTGGNLDRPGLRLLLADIESGKIDIVIVYKIDRLSRSLLDFGRVMETFENNNVSFVSVTQQFNTATSMGRLMMNVLLSFAQFEREIIGERTRDKIAAARRKGKHSGGMPVLGYDVSTEGSKLLVNEEEASRVQAIFDLYIELQGLLPVVDELKRRAWTTKRWTTRKGHMRGGMAFNRTNLHRMLTNVVYVGQIRYKDEIHPGEHKAIVAPEKWQKVQSIMQRNRLSGGPQVRNKFGALLKGLMHCKHCDCAMSPSHTKRKNGLRYRYYVCSKATKEGWQTCPTKSISAGEMEAAVVQRIRAIGMDEALIELTFQQARQQYDEQATALTKEQRVLENDLAYWNEEVRGLSQQVDPRDPSSPAMKRLADYQERIRHGEARAVAIRNVLEGLKRDLVNETEVRSALAGFDLVWNALASHEQARLIRQLVQRIEYDGLTQKANVTFHDSGILSLAVGLAQHSTEEGK